MSDRTQTIQLDPMGDDGEADYIMEEDESAWVRVGDVTLYINTFDGHIKVEALPASDVTGVPYATFRVPY